MRDQHCCSRVLPTKLCACTTKCALAALCLALCHQYFSLKSLEVADTGDQLRGLLGSAVFKYATPLRPQRRCFDHQYTQYIAHSINAHIKAARITPTGGGWFLSYGLRPVALQPWVNHRAVGTAANLMYLVTKFVKQACHNRHLGAADKEALPLLGSLGASWHQRHLTS